MPSIMKEDDQSKVLTFLTTDMKSQESFVEIYKARRDAASIDEGDSIKTSLSSTLRLTTDYPLVAYENDSKIFIVNTSQNRP